MVELDKLHSAVLEFLAEFVAAERMVLLVELAWFCLRANFKSLRPNRERERERERG